MFLYGLLLMERNGSASTTPLSARLQTTCTLLMKQALLDDGYNTEHFSLLRMDVLLNLTLAWEVIG